MKRGCESSRNEDRRRKRRAQTALKKRLIEAKAENNRLERQRNAKRQQRLNATRKKAKEAYDEFLKKTVLDKEEKKAVIYEFEGKMRNVKHKHCKCCRRIRIRHEIKGNGVCTTCSLHKDPLYFIKSNGLPVWYENGDKSKKPNFHVPPELKNLSLAEKLLIQRISPFVPMEHIKNGIFGLRGHVCAFEQDISKLSKILPRMPQDVDIIRIEQTIRSEIGSEIFHKKSFSVSRSRVLQALKWLKQHNVEYKDITIDESALDWLGESGNGFLKGNTIVIDNPETTSDENSRENDLGPAGVIHKPSGDEVQATGLLQTGGNGVLSQDDEEINRVLQDAVSQSSSKQKISVNWPTISEKPVNEFGETKVFALAFPWLFPGGFGDPKDFPRTLGQWGSMMLFYEDARFSTDKIFSFFALNYITRHRNASSGRFFLENFPCGSPDSVDELKKQVQDGDTRFINSLTYFNRRVHGSNSYWMQKRSEVYSWINHHVEVGNGAPTFFITLSCAEFFWADVAQLLKERLEMAGLDTSACEQNSPGFVQLVNDHAVVVQEYFQERVVSWLDSVGKAIFGIKHYWIRYEFAPGRGQIHAHLLAISEDQEIYKIAHEINKQDDGSSDVTRADVFAQWAKEKFNLTAETIDGFDDLDVSDNQPCSMRFTDFRDNPTECDRDGQRLLKATQVHQCSKFCMRPGKHKGKERICRCGCGIEGNEGQCDTPGFPLQDKPEVKYDHKHSLKLYMPRNHPRVVQTSMDLLSSWRANCDIQLLIYNCDPKNPDIMDVARVTDYIVAYSCKGNATMKEEREQNKHLVMTSESVTGDKLDLIRLCKQAMNKAASKRLVSKQEAVVLLGQLDLAYCTETIESVSISNSKRLRAGETSLGTKTIISKYQNRPSNQEDLSLYDFYHIVQNKGEKTLRNVRIPNFIGINGTPKFPVTQDYAKHVLIVHRPWRTYPSSSDWIGEFNHFINSPAAPTSAQLAYQRVHCRFLSKTMGFDPVADCYDNTTNPMTLSDKELMELVGLHKSDEYDYDDSILKDLNKGLDFEWDQPPKLRNRGVLIDSDEPEHWLNKKCEEFESQRTEQMAIPTHPDGSPFTLDRLYDDQKEVVMVVLDKIMEWATSDDLSSFEPLRMTLNGPAGTGKTIVINTLVALIRGLFDCNDVVQVCAPTGVAAFNAGGETLHHLFSNTAAVKEYTPFTMSESKKKLLASRFKNLLCLIIDERSLLDANLLGVSEQMMSESIYDGDLCNESWGKLPVLILVGDDYQLPSIGNGAFEIFASERKNISKSVQSGNAIFKECANTVMSLKTSKRIQSDRTADKRMLAKLRVADELSESEVKKLLSLHLESIQAKHGKKAVNDIEKDAIFLFFRNHKRIYKNLEKIVEHSNHSNPVAICKTISKGKHNGLAIKSHFKKSGLPSSAMLSVGAKVALENKNFCPQWGLHNGAVGTIDEIVFKKGTDPNQGDMPLYVVVEFPHYIGPVWDINNPKHVPIPVTMYRCEHQCCTREFVPLELAYARTIHKFQGLSAGPVDEGKVPNLYNCIVCDPDEKRYEGSGALGLLYTAVSRATTLGNNDGLESAIYFTGSDFREERIIRLTKLKGSNEDFLLAKKRQKWVAFLDRRQKQCNRQTQRISKKQDIIKNFFSANHFDYDFLHQRIMLYKFASYRHSSF